MKYCKYCKCEYELNQFRHNRMKCKKCERSYGRKYSKTNFDKRKKWRENNVQKYHKLQSDWYQREKTNISIKNKERYHSNKEFKKKKNIGRVIQGSFKRKGNCKYWNCSYEFLIKWLQFNSNSYVHEHQDHVIPRNKFKLYDENDSLNEDNIRLCYSWYNISPLAVDKNQAKHDNIDIAQIKLHIQKLKQFSAQEKCDVDSDYHNLLQKYINE